MQAKKCLQCLPVAIPKIPTAVVAKLRGIETASYVNVGVANEAFKLLKTQSSDSLILSNVMGTPRDDFLNKVVDAYKHVSIVPSEHNWHLWKDYLGEPFLVQSSKDMEDDLCLIHSRPSNTSFLEELDDAQLRGRNVIVSVDCKDSFHSLMFDSHVISILGAHKNRGICKNMKLGRIQFVDWNPDWVFAQWVCNKVFV